MLDYSTLMILNHADIRSKIKNKRSRLIERKKTHFYLQIRSTSCLLKILFHIPKSFNKFRVDNVVFLKILPCSNFINFLTIDDNLSVFVKKSSS